MFAHTNPLAFNFAVFSLLSYRFLGTAELQYVWLWCLWSDSILKWLWTLKRQGRTAHGFSGESPGRQAILDLLSFLGGYRVEEYFPCGYRTKRRWEIKYWRTMTLYPLSSCLERKGIWTLKVPWRWEKCAHLLEMAPLINSVIPRQNPPSCFSPDHIRMDPHQWGIKRSVSIENLTCNEYGISFF